jgi:dimethylaniline monooxygenase (N-oxide forming)
LIRQIIHPQIPQLAIIGYAESFSNILCNEMRCQWLVHFLDGNIELPSIKEMKKDTKMWEDSIKQNARNLRSCIVTCGIWYNDQLCKDMKCNPRRKKGPFAELFEPYGPTDYQDLVPK